MSFSTKLRSPDEGVAAESLQGRLVAEALMGSEVAARALYDLHVDGVHRLAFRLTADEELARECTQLAFVRAFERLQTFRGESSFATWIHCITRNEVMGKHRKIRRVRAVEQELTIDAPSERTSTDPILRGRIEMALGSLPELYRVIVVLHDIDGFTHDEIGRMLDIATGTSKARLSRARAQLRKLLAGCGTEYSFC